MSFEVLGVLLAAVIQGIMISLYNKKAPCEEMSSFNSSNNYSANFETNFETNSSMSSFLPNYIANL